MSRCRQYLVGLCTVLLLLFACIVSGGAQNLSNEKIQVAADALTVLKFNSEITHCELGSRDGFTCLVRDNDNTVVIKTLEPLPASTNLAITEGRRTHYFVLVFLKKIDINNTKLFYDYSDLKALKKLVKKREEGSEVPMAMIVAEEKAAPKSKKEEAAEKKMKEAEQKKIDEELARVKEEQRQKDLAKAQEEQRQKDLLAAAEAEKKRLAEEKIQKDKETKEAAALAKAKAAEEKKLAAAEKARKDQEKAAATAKAKADAKAKAEEEKKLATTKTAATPVPSPEPAKPAPEPVTAKASTETQPPKKLSRRDERILRKEKEAEEALALAKAEELRKQEEEAAAAKEKARIEEQQQQEAIAAEKERKKQEELQKQQDAIAAKAAEKEEAKRKKQELADAKAAEKEAARLKQQELLAANEAKRKEALQKQKELEEARAPLLAMAALRKRYPTINFADIPEGQMITGEYFIPVDTLENYEQSVKALSDEPCLGIRSEAVEGIDMRLEDINFSGVNAYLRVHIRNGSKKEYLVGRMLLRWDKAEGGGYNLFACYVTGFPVIPPGGEMKIVYVARGVNARDDDMMHFRMSDRVREGFTVEVPFSGKIYNDEMTRK